MKFDTKTVHGPERTHDNHNAVSTPIYTSTIFSFDSIEKGIAIHNEIEPGFYYGRLGNPTVEDLEKTIAFLEGGEAAVAFASGMGAISAAVLSNISKGDRVVAPASMYSTTVRLFEFLAKNFGIEVVFSDSTKTEQYIEEIGKGARLVWLETPSNPLLEISDIQAIANAAHKTGAVLAVDNTFATPFNQRPLSLGADIVIHSATKFLGGHSDVTAGLLVSSRNNVKKAREVGLKFLGASAAPQAAWLVLRGVKTLALRMERHNENAQELAKRLAEHLGAEKVFYPGLVSSINHEIAKKQMSGFGGILSLDAGDEEAAKRFVSKCRLCTFATSLGGVETLVQPVALMTHATLDSEAKKRAGIKGGLLRISVGIENIEDIWEDVYNSLQNL